MAGGRFGNLLASGDINRDKPNDLVVGSPGAHSGAGTVDIYYGRSKNSIGTTRADGSRVVDFATEAPSRTILGDTAGGTITAVQVFEVTGEGARDVIVGMSGNNNGFGAVYFTISPRLTLSTANVTLATDPGITTSAALAVRNASTIPITWRTSSNRTWVTLTAIQQLSVNQIDASWRIAGYGDLDGDGERDIVWEDDSGLLAVWLMRGSQVINTLWLSINQVDPKWKVRGVGDVNGDGKADLIFRDTDGWLAVWYMDGAHVIGTDFLSINRLSDPNWVLVGAGDTNGDGRADIVWQHKTEGWLGVWSLDGARVINTQLLSIDKLADPKWAIVGVGDVNGDGRSDLLWQHSDGTLATWWLNGAQVTGTSLLNPSRLSDPAWKVAGPK